MRKLREGKNQSPSFNIDILRINYIQSLLRIYKSIRYDFKKSLELKDEDMEQMFQELNIYFAGFEQTINEMGSIVDQMLDMATYCKRAM